MIAAGLLFGAAQLSTQAQSGPTADKPVLTSDGKLEFPAKYREWIYLTSGMNMSYSPNAMDHDMFDNVFVNPSAYQAFLATGTWPDGTMLVLEGRMAGGKASINQAGHFQTDDVMALEVHLKDNRVAGGWSFYSFDDQKVTAAIPHTANCYSCHEQHAAVDTTFVQFYPTLLPIAKQKGTLSAAYVKDEAAKK
jgi:hypothetical protein